MKNCSMTILLIFVVMMVEFIEPIPSSFDFDSIINVVKSAASHIKERVAANSEENTSTPDCKTDVPPKTTSKMHGAAYFTCLAYMGNNVNIYDSKCLSLPGTVASELSYANNEDDGWVSSKPLKDDTVVIAFRGDSSKDHHKTWYTWAFAQTKLFHNIPVLDKAYTKFMEIEEKVLEIILLHKDENIKFLFTGHSVGGSKAILTAIKAHKLGVQSNRIEIITFNAVRTGKSELNNYLEDNELQHSGVVDMEDIITVVPLLFQDQPNLFYISDGETQCKLDVTKRTQKLITEVLNYLQGGEVDFLASHNSCFGVADYFG